MKRARLLLAFLLGLAAGLGGATLLLMERQCWKAERLLREDFRVLLFLKTDLDGSAQEVLEEKLLALPEVEEARYVSREAALGRLRREDPELVESVALLGDNPLNPAYEVRLGPGAFGRFSEWISGAEPLADWADIRYKPSQVRAILQAQFYGHFMNLAFSAMVCLAALMALTGLWPFSRRPKGAAALRGPVLISFIKSPGSICFIVSAAGGVCGAGLAFLMAWPMRLFAPWWAWPSGPRQAALVLGAAVAGWALCEGD